MCKKAKEQNKMEREENNRSRDSGFGRQGGFNNRQGGGSSRPGGFNKRPGGAHRSFNDGPREMHKATCSECGNECEVPFKPSGEKPVYCRDCFQKHRPPRD